jgi:drug/metabolite transporter (DMT)-like permease
MFSALPAPVRGAIWMMGSTAAWAMMAALTRYLAGEIHVFEIVFFRSLFGMVFLLPWLFSKGLRGLYTQRLGLHLVRGFVGLATVYLVFTAISLAPLAELAAIMTLRPIMASVAAVVVLHEAARGRRWSATLIGFVGALIILRPGFSEVSMGALLMLAAVVLMAALSIVMKSLSRTESPDCIVTWQMVIFTPMTFIPALYVWQTPSLAQLGIFVFIGLAGTLTQRSLTRAFAAADATVVLPFEFTRMIFSAALGFLFFAELPDLWTWVGGGLIFAGTVTMAHLEGREARKTS